MWAVINRGRAETFSRKVSPKGINVNWLQFRKHGTVKLNIVTSRVISRNVFIQNRNQLYWLNRIYAAIFSKWIHLIGEYPSGEGLEFLRGMEKPSRYSKFTQFHYSYQRVNTGPLGICPTVLPSVSLRCTVGRDFVTQAASLITMVITVKTLLQRSLHNCQPKKSLPVCTYAESICFIFHSI